MEKDPALASPLRRIPCVKVETSTGPVLYMLKFLPTGGHNLLGGTPKTGDTGPVSNPTGSTNVPLPLSSGPVDDGRNIGNKENDIILAERSSKKRLSVPETQPPQPPPPPLPPPPPPPKDVQWEMISECPRYTAPTDDPSQLLDQAEEGELLDLSNYRPMPTLVKEESPPDGAGDCLWDGPPPPLHHYHEGPSCPPPDDKLSGSADNSSRLQESWEDGLLDLRNFPRPTPPELAKEAETSRPADNSTTRDLSPASSDPLPHNHNRHRLHHHHLHHHHHHHQNHSHHHHHHHHHLRVHPPPRQSATNQSVAAVSRYYQEHLRKAGVRTTSGGGGVAAPDQSGVVADDDHGDLLDLRIHRPSSPDLLTSKTLDTPPCDDHPAKDTTGQSLALHPLPYNHKLYHRHRHDHQQQQQHVNPVGQSSYIISAGPTQQHSAMSATVDVSTEGKATNCLEQDKLLDLRTRQHRIPPPVVPVKPFDSSVLLSPSTTTPPRPQPLITHPLLQPLHHPYHHTYPSPPFPPPLQPPPPPPPLHPPPPPQHSPDSGTTSEKDSARLDHNHNTHKLDGFPSRYSPISTDSNGSSPREKMADEEEKEEEKEEEDMEEEEEEVEEDEEETEMREDASANNEDDGFHKKRRPGRKKGQVSKVLHLWEFILDLLRNPHTCPRIIHWENEKEGVFRVLQSAEVARLWGEKKRNKNAMTYEKLSRSLRYSRTEGFFDTLPKGHTYPKKLCFKFGPKSHGWRNSTW